MAKQSPRTPEVALMFEAMISDVLPERATPAASNRAVRVRDRFLRLEEADDLERLFKHIDDTERDEFMAAVWTLVETCLSEG